MIGVSVVPEDSGLVDMLAAMKAIGSGAELRNTNNALNQVATMVRTAWGAKVGIDKIEIEKTSPTSRRVFSRDKMVHWLEKGLPAYDMRQTHTKGRKSRRVKPKIGPGGKIITSWKVKNPDGTYRTVIAGSSYLIIPFKHFKSQGKGTDSKTIADYYPSVQRQIKDPAFKKSRVVTAPADSKKVSPNYWGEQIQRAEYDWGSRIEFPDEPENKNLQGMVAFDQSTEKKTMTGFLTFRVVSVNSPAGTWQHPGIKAKHYLENIINEGQDVIREVIEGGVRRDFG